MMAQSTPAISVEQLGHRYGSRQALADVSFEVRSGEIVGLAGPNGGGKTTCFRILSTLLRPTSGDARVFDSSVTRQPASVRRRLGVVFQSPALDTKLTVMENLKHHGHLHGISGKRLRDRCGTVLEALRITDRARDRVEALSGGLKRRAELAKALLHRPDVLLLDEPSTGLDPTVRREFFDHLEELRRQSGLTVLMTTHDMQEAERCDRVGILNEGSLVALDSPARLKTKIGGEVIVIRCPDPESIREQVGQRFGGNPVVMDGSLRLEVVGGHQRIDHIVEAFPEQIRSITWGLPTLDDVFVHLTGRQLEEEPE